MPSAEFDIPIIPPCQSKYFLSVMIPSYNRVGYLKRTLQTILNQRLMPENVQIMVVDNDSKDEDPEPMVREIGKGRVQFHRNERNLGLTGNFNRCLELAQGEWVHLLMSDDFVYDGFYAEVERLAAQEPAIECIAFRSNIVRHDDSIISEPLDLSDHGVPGMARTLYLHPMPIQLPGVVVKRSVYERLGGFAPRFRYVLDVELLSRVFFNSKTFFSPKILSALRLHADNISANNIVSGGECWELYDLVPAMERNMKLTRGEIKTLYGALHRKVNDHCRKVAVSGNVRLWLKLQKLYFKNLKYPSEVLNFALRFERNLRYHILAKLGHARKESGLI